MFDSTQCWRAGLKEGDNSATPMTALLELKQVSKTFGGVRALNNVTLNLYEGEIVGLIGPNGAGKTTLVNVITGVTRATSGSVIFEGIDVTRQRPHQGGRRGP